MHLEITDEDIVGGKDGINTLRDAKATYRTTQRIVEKSVETVDARLAETVTTGQQFGQAVVSVELIVTDLQAVQ